VRLLLDTHVLLWRLDDRLARLPEALQDALDDRGNEVFVSAASLWEISIKAALGKLDVADGMPQVIARAGFEELPVRAAHAWAVRALPPVHNDPFDRMLVAQAGVEQLTLVTHDRNISRYSTPVWLI
jgi:PIN domain nuclease of toxin-antitoxin system